MNETVKYFNIKSDADLFALVLQALILALLLMVVFSYSSGIVKIIVSFFIFKRPVIKLLKISNLDNGELEIYWKVNGALFIELDPIIKKIEIVEILKLYVNGLTAFFVLPFISVEKLTGKKMTFQKNQLRAYKYKKSKFKIPEGFIRIKNEGDLQKVSLKAYGIWGIAKQTENIPGYTDKSVLNQLPNTSIDLFDKYTSLIYHQLLLKDAQNLKNKMANFMEEKQGIDFMQKTMLCSQNSFLELNQINRNFVMFSDKSMLYTNRTILSNTVTKYQIKNDYLNYRKNLFLTTLFPEQ